MTELHLRNRQRAYPLNLRLLRRIAQTVLTELFGSTSGELGIHLLGPQSMAKLNWDFLQHEGPTDVITFNHSQNDGALYGEIFICPKVAVEQARRYQVAWQKELTRYLVHGLLHLKGYDDKTSKVRRIMKKHENRLVRRMADRFPLNELGQHPRLDV